MLLAVLGSWCWDIWMLLLSCWIGNGWHSYVDLHWKFNFCHENSSPRSPPPSVHIWLLIETTSYMCIWNRNAPKFFWRLPFIVFQGTLNPTRKKGVPCQCSACFLECSVSSLWHLALSVIKTKGRFSPPPCLWYYIICFDKDHLEKSMFPKNTIFELMLCCTANLLQP